MCSRKADEYFRWVVYFFGASFNSRHEFIQYCIGVRPGVRVVDCNQLFRQFALGETLLSRLGFPVSIRRSLFARDATLRLCARQLCTVSREDFV